MPYQPYRHRGFYLPPERHVIEVVQRPNSGNFIINGTTFTAKTAACNALAAGERIRLIAGDCSGAASTRCSTTTIGATPARCGAADGTLLTAKNPPGEPTGSQYDDPRQILTRSCA